MAAYRARRHIPTDTKRECGFVEMTAGPDEEILEVPSGMEQATAAEVEAYWQGVQDGIEQARLDAIQALEDWATDQPNKPVERGEITNHMGFLWRGTSE